MNLSYQRIGKGVNDVSRSRDGSFMVGSSPLPASESVEEQGSDLNLPGLHATIVEIIPRVGILSIPDFAHDYRARDTTTVFIDDWVNEMDSNGYHVVVFETNGQSSLSASYSTVLHNQFVVFPALPDRFNMTQVLNTMKAFMYWYYLDQRDCIVLFNSENLNRLSVCASLMLIDPSSWTPDTVMDFISQHISGLVWCPSDKRFLNYVSRLLKYDANMSFRPRSIMVKQLLIDSCFCEDADLHVEISDSNGIISSGESIVQFSDPDTRSIAIHFPRMKFHSFNENVTLVLSSRRHSIRLTYRFNTGFIDNLTSSVISIESSNWDVSALDDFMNPPPRFHVQVITVPVGLNTGQKILAPYTIPSSFIGNIVGKELFCKYHSVVANVGMVEELVRVGGGLPSQGGTLDIEIGLKIFENNFLDASTFLIKYCSHRVAVSGAVAGRQTPMGATSGGRQTPSRDETPSDRTSMLSPVSMHSLSSQILRVSHNRPQSPMVKSIPSHSPPITARHQNRSIRELEPVRVSDGDGNMAGARVYSYRKYQLSSASVATRTSFVEEYDLSPAGGQSSPLSNTLASSGSVPVRRNSGLVAQLLADSLKPRTPVSDKPPPSLPDGRLDGMVDQSHRPAPKNIDSTLRLPKYSASSTPGIVTLTDTVITEPHLGMMKVPDSDATRTASTVVSLEPTKIVEFLDLAAAGNETSRKVPQPISPILPTTTSMVVGSSSTTPVVSTPAIEEFLVPMSPSDEQPREPRQAIVTQDLDGHIDSIEPGLKRAEPASSAVGTGNQSIASSQSTSDEAVSTFSGLGLNPANLISHSAPQVEGGSESGSSSASFHSAFSDSKTPAGSIRRKQPLPVIVGASYIVKESTAANPPVEMISVKQDPVESPRKRTVTRSGSRAAGEPLSPLSVGGGDSPRPVGMRIGGRRRGDSVTAVSGETLLSQNRLSVQDFNILDSTVIHVPDDLIGASVDCASRRTSVVGETPPPTIPGVLGAGQSFLGGPSQIKLQIPGASPGKTAPPPMPGGSPAKSAPPHMPPTLPGSSPAKSVPPPMPGSSPGKSVPPRMPGSSPAKSAPPPIPPTLPGGSPAKSAPPPMPPTLPGGSPAKSAPPPIPPSLPGGSPAKSAPPPMPPSLPGGSPAKSAPPPMPGSSPAKSAPPPMPGGSPAKSAPVRVPHTVEAPSGSPTKSSAPPLPASLSGLGLGTKPLTGPSLVPVAGPLASPRIPGGPSPIPKASSMRPMAPIPFTNQNNAPYKMGGAPPPIPPTVSETETSQELPLGRRLYWKTLRNVNDTIWETMKSGESDMLDFDDMQVVFKGPDGGMAGSGGVGGGSLAPGASTIGLGKSGTSGLLDSQLITLLEAKRAQNIGVVIARVPIEIVTERLTDLDTDGGELSVEIFERLRTVLPTDEEVACFNQYRGDTEKLRDIEKRIFKLFRLSRLSARIKFCLISLQLPTVCDELRKEIGTLRQCVSEIRSSQRLKKLLHIVLLLGNYVNHGSRGSAAGARGFSIESLSKLAEFKSQTDSGITTLHFLAARLLQNDPKIIEEIYAELVSLKPASRIATDSILATINSVKRDPDIVKHEISMYRQVYNENALVRLDRFVTETEPMIVSIMTEWNLCEQDLIDIRRFFGEDPKKLSSDDFINHLRNFIDSLISTCTDLKKRPKKFAKILATDEKERGSREGIPKMTSATNEDSLEYVSDVGPSPPVDEGISST